MVVRSLICPGVSGCDLCVVPSFGLVICLR